MWANFVSSKYFGSVEALSKKVQTKISNLLKNQCSFLSVLGVGASLIACAVKED
jgi:hypothetical protein